MYNTSISAVELMSELDKPDWLVVDCRHDLAAPEAGRTAHAAAHIPGARYAHLEDDLSGPIVPGLTGRHPLPSLEKMEKLFSAWGVTPATQVVVYDDKNGAIAARLWWMLRYVGHPRVAVLDGGLAAWQGAGYPLDGSVKERTPTRFEARPQAAWTVDAATLRRQETDANTVLVDARAPERYRGEVEPIDPVAGHIPGAINLPFADNWTADGLLKSPEELRARFAALPAAENVTFYCGSGVTACHNLLAYAHAGLGDARLYPGSWSEWIVEEAR